MRTFAQIGLGTLVALMLVCSTSVRAADSDMENFRWADSRRSNAFADFTPAFRTEQRLQSYLEDYLDPSQFAIIVNPKATRRQGRPETTGQDLQSLPGLPGWSDAKEGQKQSYFDLDGRFHLYPEDRPALSVEVVIDQGVDKNKLTLFKRILPKVAGMDGARGDELRVSSGTLLRAPIASPLGPSQSPNWLETLANNRAAFLFLTLLFVAGTATVISVFYFLYRSLGPIEQPARKESQAPTQPQGVAKKSRYEAETTNAIRTEGPSSTKQTEILRDVLQQAKKHPEQMGRLICAWIQAGMVRKAAWLLQNFDMALAEQVLRHIPSAESGMLKLELFTSFDSTSTENQTILGQTRQELIFLSARESRESGKQPLSYLAELEPDVLMEVIASEPVQNVAMVVSHIPPNMLRDYLTKRSPKELIELFDALGQLGNLTPEANKSIQEILKKKTDRVRSLPLTENGKTALMIDLLSGIQSATAKKQVLGHLDQVSPKVASRVRENVFFFEDIFNLADDALRVLFTEVDPIVISKALIGSPVRWRDRLVAVLPKTSGEILEFEASTSKTLTPDETTNAQSLILTVFANLVKQNVLSTKSRVEQEKETPTPVINKEAA